MYKLAQIVFKLITIIAAEKMLRDLLANYLELLKNSTKNDIDDKILQPAIDALRGVTPEVKHGQD